MATITTDTFLDGGTARTAAEVWQMNGGILTIRTDTRYHANSPAGMTGSLGNLTISSTLGGGVLIDGRNIRELWFNSGTGTVPAIGTIVTQGGVSGYLLGVYLNISQAPSAVGSSMPTEGFMKFREVTGGSFAAGALTGIGASAIEPDRASWLEVVMDQATAITVPRLGFFRTRGTWYELKETTNGTANQLISMPNHGGQAGNPRWPAVWIETAPGSNVYESYPALLPTDFITANLGTDARSKFICTQTSNGVISIGGNGVITAGFLPPAGCRIRIPNVIGRNTTSANRTFNLPPSATLATRPDFTTTSAGAIDIEYFTSDWYHLFASPNNVYVRHSAVFDIHSTSNEASPTILENYVVAPHLGGQIPLTGSANSAGGTITDCKFIRSGAGAGGHAVSMTLCVDNTYTRVMAGVITFARNAAAYAFNFAQCTRQTLNQCMGVNGELNFTSSFDSTVTDYDHTDRFVGSTNTTTGIFAIRTQASCNNIKFNGLTFGFNGTVAGFHNPYGGVYNTQNCNNIDFRNLGTFSARRAAASDALAPAFIFQDLGGNNNIRVQRCYMTNTRTSLTSTVNSSKNILMESLLGTVGAVVTNSVDSLVKANRSASVSVTGAASVYGTFAFDMFLNDTTGRMWWAMNEPTTATASLVQLTLAGASGGFTSGGQVAMPTVGDVLVMEFPYFVLGHTAFQNVAPTITGTNTGNFTYEYQINTGTGFGAYKVLNAANLSAETISPSAGVKLKLRVTTTVASTTNALTYIQVATNSTALAQQNNLYPLDLAPIVLTGLTVGSRVQVYDTTNNVEIFNGIASAATLEVEVPYVADFNARVRIMFANTTTANLFIEFTQSCGILGFSRAVTSEVDSVYVANAINGFTVTGITIDDAALLVEMEDGTLSWAQIYAYETAWLTTEVGIRDEGRFITAIDSANYVLDGFRIKNISSPSLPLVITGGWGRDSVTGQTVTLIDTTGGTIFSNPDLVVAFATGSGLSPAQDATLSKLDTLTENVSGLRFTTKALEQAPAGGGGGSLTAADVWSYSPRELTTAFPSVPSAAANAAAVRTELTTELGRIDVATSSRLATAGYTVPPTVAAIRTEIDTNSTKLDVAVGTRLATAGYTAPPSAASNATAVRTELSTELARIDVATSSRLATAGYTVPPTAAAIRSEIDTNSTKLDVAVGTRLASASFVPAPTASANATAVRSELTVELARIDANITSRLATAGYMAPANADVAAIKAKTDALPADPASNTQVNTRLAAAAYTAPDNAGIAAVQAKTDNLPADSSAELTTIKTNTNLIPAAL